MEKKVVIIIEEDVHYKEFAEFVADALLESYGSHNVKPFMSELLDIVYKKVQEEIINQSKTN